MAKRGFFAELNYQAQQAEKRKRQEQAAAVRQHNAALRAAEKAGRDAERARTQLARATDAQRKAAEKEAARLHVESRLAEVEVLNTQLEETYEEIDGLLQATLDVDDFIDLEDLKITEVEHPPLELGSLAAPVPPMPEPNYPPEPVLVEPAAPTGVAAALGGKKKHLAAVERAKAEHATAHSWWLERCQKLYAEYLAGYEKRQRAEAERLAKVADLQAGWQEMCRERDAEAEERNQELAKLINDLAFDVPAAIEEYVGIVLSNSVYPDTFPVTHNHQFDLSTRELTLQVAVPEPAVVPAVKEYRYVKAKDEITSTSLPVKAQKDRYADAVWQVAVRTLHEVFEADRAAKIRSIALTVGADRIAPATGLPETVPLVIAAADRDTFNSFDLTNVIPHATLTHLGAAMSKSPFDLTPADTSPGVRTRGMS